MLRDLKLWLTIILLLGIFVFTSYLAQKYDTQLQQYLQTAGSLKGAFLFIILTILTVIIAPITTLPLISVLANAWGSFLVGILTIIGETIGAMLAFYIAKKYGRPLVGRLTSEKSLIKIEGFIPEKPEHAFFTVVFLRIAIPADILSYALGLFSNIGTWTYFTATLVGVVAPSMFFAYTGTLPVKYQVFILTAGLLFIIYLLRFWMKHFIQNKNGISLF